MSDNIITIGEVEARLTSRGYYRFSFPMRSKIMNFHLYMLLGIDPKDDYHPYDLLSPDCDGFIKFIKEYVGNNAERAKEVATLISQLVAPLRGNLPVLRPRNMLFYDPESDTVYKIYYEPIQNNLTEHIEKELRQRYEILKMAIEEEHKLRLQEYEMRIKELEEKTQRALEEGVYMVLSLINHLPEKWKLRHLQSYGYVIRYNGTIYATQIMYDDSIVDIPSEQRTLFWIKNPYIVFSYDLLLQKIRCTDSFHPNARGTHVCPGSLKGQRITSSLISLVTSTLQVINLNSAYPGTPKDKAEDIFYKVINQQEQQKQEEQNQQNQQEQGGIVWRA